MHHPQKRSQKTQSTKRPTAQGIREGRVAIEAVTQNSDPQNAPHLEAPIHMGRGVIAIPYDVLEIALPLPDDYRVLSCVVDPFRNTLALIVEAPDLPSFGAGMPLPEIDVHVSEAEREGHIYRTATATVRPYDVKSTNQNA